MSRIRPSYPDEAPALREIESLAGESFRSIGMASVAGDVHGPSEELLMAYARNGRSWVAVDESGSPVGYVLVDVVDGNAHVEQISIRPDSQGQGLGRQLLETVRTWAIETGRPAITLTTFAHVPWNRPLYEHLGFVVLTEEEFGPELQSVRREEADHGLDPVTRVCMRISTTTSLVDVI